MSIFVNISSNFLKAIFRPQATTWTKKPLNPAKIGAKTTPFFYKIRNKMKQYIKALTRVGRDFG